jgi:hypothetical protein
MIGKKAESEIDEVPVSDKTISRRVDDMSNDIEDVLSEILKNTHFALQVDESTYITNKTQLLAFVQFENEGEIMEICCCCKELPETTKGQDISTSCLLIWNPVVCHGTSVLEFALKMCPQ